MIRALLCLGAALVPLAGQSTAVLPVGTLLDLELPARIRVYHPGQRISARLTEPVYAANRMLLPAGTEVEGELATVRAARWAVRLQAGMGGDFSPPPRVAAHFDGLRATDGSLVAILTQAAPYGPPLHLVTAAVGHTALESWEKRVSAVYHQDEDGFEALLRQQTQWEAVKEEAVDSLPYRPATLAAGTAYQVALAAPVTLPFRRDAVAPQAAPAADELPAGLQLHARLDTALNSRTTSWGAPVRATLDRPALDAQQRIVLAQGTQLIGTVVQVRPAHWFARGGRLRFVFSSLEAPGGAPAAVAAHLDGTASSQAVRIDGEGMVTAAPPAKATSFLALGLVVAGGIHGDADNATALNAGSGTHLHIWGTLAGMALSPARPLMFELGMVGAGRTVFQRFIAPGHQIIFLANTALEIRVEPPSAHGRPIH